MIVLGNSGQDVTAGVYNGDTSQTKSGHKLYAGAINRQLTWGVATHLMYEGIPYILLNPEQADISETVKTARLNAYNLDQDSLLINFEAKTSNKAGICIYGNVRAYSIDYGDIIYNNLKAELPKITVYRPCYQCEDEFSMLESFEGHAFNITIPVNKYPDLIYSPRFIEAVSHSLTQSLVSCLTLDPD